MSDFTVSGKTLPYEPSEQVNPLLFYYRWLEFDTFDTFKRDDVKLKFIRRSARAIQLVNNASYEEWHASFASAVAAAGGEVLRSAPTTWRAVCGWASNPALETGLTLHPLWGFPYIPGSAVKGAVLAAAEAELAARFPRAPAANELPTEPPVELLSALADAEVIRALFGGVVSQQSVADAAGQPDGKLVIGLPGLVDLLSAWIAAISAGLESDPAGLPAWRDSADLMNLLIEEPAVGGLVQWLDAVPSARAFGRTVVEADVLTPHQASYYAEALKHRQSGTAPSPPSDGDTLNPIPFLAVAPGTTFEFRARWRRARVGDARESDASLDGVVERVGQSGLWKQVQGWLEVAITDLGLGAKTSAGYGYFGGGAAPAEDDGVPGLVDIWKLPTREELELAKLPPHEQEAIRLVPDGLTQNELSDAMDRLAREQQGPAVVAAARRISANYSAILEDWRGRQNKAMVRRVRWLDRLLAKDDQL